MNTLNSNEVRLLCDNLFGRSVEVPDDLRSQVELLCQSMRDEIEEDDPDLDREWSERLIPEVEHWLNEMTDVQMHYEERIDQFWVQIKADRRLSPYAVPDNPSPSEVIRGVVARMNDFLEAEIPLPLLANDTATLDIDVQELSAWWDAEDVAESIDLRAMVARAIERTPISWRHTTEVLLEVILGAICEGTVPLPSFHSGGCANGVQRWYWTSPESEEFQSKEESATVEPDFVWSEQDEAEYVLWERTPALAMQLEIPLLNTPECFAEISANPQKSFDQICAYANAAGISPELSRRVIGVKLAESFEIASRLGDQEAMSSRVKLMNALVTEQGFSRSV